MEPNSKIRLLDQSLRAFVSSKDPTGKTSSKSVFMGKRELGTFYGKMYSKANQQIKLQQKKVSSIHDQNKLLMKQQQRIRDKIYSRTFYSRTGCLNSHNLSNKENIKINKNPLISDNSFKASKRIKGPNDSKFLTLANAELLNTEYFQKNKGLRQRKAKSMTQGSRVFKQRENSKNGHKNSFDMANKSVACMDEDPFEEGMPHRKAELIEIYQKLYEQFTKQKIKTMHSKSRIQGKFSKGVIPEKPQLIKAGKSILKFSIVLTNKRAPIKL